MIPLSRINIPSGRAVPHLLYTLSEMRSAPDSRKLLSKPATGARDCQQAVTSAEHSGDRRWFNAGGGGASRQVVHIKTVLLNVTDRMCLKVLDLEVGFKDTVRDK